MFKIEIDTGNDAFAGSAETERGEIARILGAAELSFVPQPETAKADA